MKYSFTLRHLYLFCLVLASLFLAGCGSSPVADNSPDNNINEPTDQALRYEQLANLATDLKEKAVYQYLAALSWYEKGFVDRAYFLLAGLDSSYLSAKQQLDRQLTLSKYHRDRGELALALQLLEDESLQAALRASDNSQKSLWATETAELSLLLGDYERAFRVFDYAISYSTDNEDLDKLRTGLWQSLTLADPLPSPPYASNETRGWAELARINNQSSGTVSDLYINYLLWQDQYYEHPARRSPPPSFAMLEEIATADRPKVALLLPVSGNLSAAGNAILDGYMSARAGSYNDSQLIPSDPLAPNALQIFDTNAMNMSTIVRNLREQNFDIVIGPLDRNRVNDYAQIMPDIPTLALNSLPEDINLGEKPIVGLSLNVETEAIQAAIKALQDGHQSSLILVPNSSWGDRAGLAFSDFWQSEGGDVIEFLSYGDSTTHAELIEQGLHIDESNQRKAALQAELGKILEYTPRRREDVDALFLAGTPNQARQLKPMLAFFFAEDIPVYSTSNLYSGYPDATADRDLDGIQFSTMPWILESGHPFRQAIALERIASATELKMQALGVDSYFLSQRLKQFLEAPDTLYWGVIGKLSRTSQDQDLERKQVWARFRGGQAEPLTN